MHAGGVRAAALGMRFRAIFTSGLIHITFLQCNLTQ